MIFSGRGKRGLWKACLSIYSQLFALATSPIAFIQTLFSCLPLLKGPQDFLLGFSAENSISYLFYKNQYENQVRARISGFSPFVGLGNYPIWHWIHLSRLGSKIFALSGARVTTGCTLFWLMSTLLYVRSASLLWILTLMIILMFSSTIFATAFVNQNYQILGFMWYPILFYSISNHSQILSSLIITTISYFSITAALLVYPILIIEIGTVHPGSFLSICIIPITILVARLSKIPRGSSSFRNTWIDLLKLIGFTRRGVKYRRKSMRVNFPLIYITITHILLAGGIFLQGGKKAELIVITTIMMTINETLFRIADRESLILLNVSVAVYAVLINRPSILLVILFLIVVNPLPIFLGIPMILDKHNRKRIKPLSPFNLQPVLKATSDLLGDQRIGRLALMCFQDPVGEYEKLFMDYSKYIEVPIWAGSNLGIHVIPDWYFVAQTNYPNAHSVWCSSPSDASRILRDYGGNCAIFFGDNHLLHGESLSSQFELVGKLDFSEFNISRRDNPVIMYIYVLTSV